MDSVFAYEYTPSTLLSVSDEDSAEFLQSQFSNELRPFNEGQCTYGLWLDVRGKVLADSWVLCRGAEEFSVISENSPEEVVRGTLAGHIIADDVELKALEPSTSTALVGPGAVDLLQRLGLPVPEAASYLEANGLHIFNGRRSVGKSFECMPLSVEAGRWLSDQLAEAKVNFVSGERMQLERLAAGIPAVPADIGPADLPGEGGFEADAISFTKGCFLGQEVVARMHNVGQARRGLFRVSGKGCVPDSPCVLTVGEGKSAGELRSVVSVGDGWLGVALLKLRFSDASSVYSAAGQLVQIDGPLRELK